MAAKKPAGAATDDGDMFLGVCGVERRGRHSELKALANGDVADNTRMLVVDGERSCVWHRTVSHEGALRTRRCSSLPSDGMTGSGRDHLRRGQRCLPSLSGRDRRESPLARLLRRYNDRR